MSIFELIFQELVKIENRKHTDNKQISKMFLFYQYFIPSNYIRRNEYPWRKYIKYKYFILKNYLHVCDSIIDDNSKEEILGFFSTAQKHMMSLYRFKNICLDKTKYYLNEPQDFQFNLLSETPKKHTIDIIQSGIKYQFSIFDLIRIINTSLSYEYNFFTDPKKIKNPWNNNPFSLANLYNIYFFIRYTNIIMPILFERFFQSNFNLDMFENHNQLIIKNYIIENCHNFSNMKKISHIYNMIDNFNSKCLLRSKIIIDDKFPEKRLLDVMEPYLKTYLLSAYSYEDDLLIKYRSLLMKKLREFNKTNPKFGRKIVCLNIRKLYYISCLKYNENAMIFIPHNVYLPKPSMISLKHKCYFIDYFEQEKYTIFPFFENSKNMKNNNATVFKVNVTRLGNIIQKYIFTDEQHTILKDKYYSIVSEEMKKVNKSEQHNNGYMMNDTDDDSSLDSTLADTEEDSELVDNIIDPDADINVVQDDSVDLDQDDGIDVNLDDGVDLDTDDGVDVNLDDGIYIIPDDGVDVHLDNGIDVHLDNGIDVHLDNGIDVDLNDETVDENNVIQYSIEPYTTLHDEAYNANDVDESELTRIIELLNINEMLTGDDEL